MLQPFSLADNQVILYRQQSAIINIYSLTQADRDAKADTVAVDPFFLVSFSS
jgi:hypothetical protein